jgi:hypothetical protein
MLHLFGNSNGLPQVLGGFVYTQTSGYFDNVLLLFSHLLPVLQLGGC